MLFGAKRNDEKTPGDTGFNLMPDGSVSWEQPDSKGVAGWEGLCGQTAVANLLTTHRERVGVSPEEVARAADDWAPGTVAPTLMRAIRQIAGDAERYVISNENDLSTATPWNPIVCLMQWGGGYFHYVTVVGAGVDRVVFNHWGVQDYVSAERFDQLWGFHAGTMVDGIARGLLGMRRYTSIYRR